MGYEINWHVNNGDPILSTPQYQKYSNTAFADITLAGVKGDLEQALASNETAPVVNYLCWLLRVVTLLA
jgi:hypothetical protein